jgi:hypothetical protein
VTTDLVAVHQQSKSLASIPPPYMEQNIRLL